MTNPTKNILAVVVTFNRLPLLKICIDALRKQTILPDKIIVINNSSNDGTEEWLKEQKDIGYITQANVGGAGGFHTGIKYGYDNGFEWTWCMDDDGFPKEDALEKLLAQHSDIPRLLNSAVIDIKDRESFVFKTKGYKKIKDCKKTVIRNIAHLFNSTLINRKIIDKVGLPDQRLFVWGDETEYCYRISRKFNIELWTVTNSIHYHPLSAFSYLEDWNYSTNWKMYYFFRNKYPVFRSKFKALLMAKTVYFLFIRLYCLNILIFQKTDRKKKIKLLFRSAKDALRDNFEMTPSRILAELLK